MVNNGLIYKYTRQLNNKKERIDSYIYIIYVNLALFDLIAPKELKKSLGISCIFNTDKSCKHDFQST